MPSLDRVRAGVVSIVGSHLSSVDSRARTSTAAYGNHCVVSEGVSRSPAFLLPRDPFCSSQAELGRSQQQQQQQPSPPRIRTAQSKLRTRFSAAAQQLYVCIDCPKIRSTRWFFAVCLCPEFCFCYFCWHVRLRPSAWLSRRAIFSFLKHRRGGSKVGAAAARHEMCVPVCTSFVFLLNFTIINSTSKYFVFIFVPHKKRKNSYHIHILASTFFLLCDQPRLVSPEGIDWRLASRIDRCDDNTHAHTQECQKPTPILAPPSVVVASPLSCAPHRSPCS